MGSCCVVSFWPTTEVDDLACCACGVGLVAAGNGARNGSLPIGFPAACRAIPLLWAIERRTTKQPIDLRGILVRPECQQVAEREISF